METSQHSDLGAPEDGDDAIAPAIEQCLEELSDGDADAIERLCAAHPDRADEIRERVGMLLQMNLIPGAHRAAEFPERLAEFRLLRRLGGGGMGVVYEARQETLGRTVALKLIRPEHLYFPRARERFRRETEAVARLAHPGIVAIHTVGEAAGVPYFAMELVEGATLAAVLQALETRAAEHLSGADLRAIVEASGAVDDEAHSPATQLFGSSWVDACTRIALAMAEALGHAHSRGVLHRDIKPSNIAVTPQGRVVLLDFGLASSQDELRLTTSGSALGSVLYMAPEQVAGRTSEIDRRTDVYALGVTLYELLTLRTPFGGDNVEQTRAAILDGRAPSLRLRNSQISRDLEIVCLKAIERDAARRYESMEAFGADLRAILEGQPIRARAPGRLGSAWRWMRRRPAAVLATTSAVLLVLGLPSALYWQQRGHNVELRRALDAEVEARLAADQAQRSESVEREKAQIEAREADQVAGFLVELFGASDPNRSRGAEITARALLERGRERVERALVDQPELAARLLERIGESYCAMNLYQDAVTTLERAVELRVNEAGDEDRRTAFSKIALGKARRLAGLSSAVGILREACTTLESLGESETLLGLNASIELAVALLERGQAREALQQLEFAQTIQSKLPGDTRKSRLACLSALAVAHVSTQDYVRAEAAAREALAIEDELYPNSHPSRLGDLNTLATALSNLERLDEAEAAYGQLIDESRRIYGVDSAATALFELNRAVLYEQRDELADAETSYRSVLGRLRALLGAQHPNAIRALSNLGVVLVRTGRYEEALELFVQARDEAVARGAGDSVFARLCSHRIGVAHEALGDFEAAERELRAASNGDSVGDGHRTPWIQLSLAGVLRRSDATIAEARSIASAWADFGGVEECVEARFVLASIDYRSGRARDALEHIASAVERAGERTPRIWAWPALRSLRGRIALDEGRSTPGWADVEDGLRELRRLLGPAHAEVRETLAWALEAAAHDDARRERLASIVR